MLKENNVYTTNPILVTRRISLLPVGLSVLPVGGGISVSPIEIYLVQVGKSVIPVGISVWVAF
jgi:hypothetical protein